MLEPKAALSFADWEKADVRLGEIVEATLPDWSNKLIQLRVNFGSELGERTIFTGLRASYALEELQGKCALFLINLPPKKMGDAVSEGMILALDGGENERPAVILLDRIAPLGSALH